MRAIKQLKKSRYSKEFSFIHTAIHYFTGALTWEGIEKECKWDRLCNENGPLVEIVEKQLKTTGLEVFA